ncbi:MAG: copper chaperone PCu(A)C [Xanthomonadales bacterium]|jgi:copper(I)-binding protein|nr:copper chaperone PCu(A)C [Xanthomonadales bacterium]
MYPARSLNLFLHLLVAAALCGPVTALADIAVEDAWARATPPGARTGAVYLTLVNDGKTDALVAAATDAADRAELHTHVHENGMMAMREVGAIELPPGGEARLKPHGDHVMLFGLRGPLVAGETISLTLEFASAEPLTVEIPVRDGRSR